MKEIARPETIDAVVFRLRSIDQVLDRFKELETQTIYLAPPHKLNDPLEGYQNILWMGDSILWENLLRHYVLSLLWAQAYCLIDETNFEDHALQAGLTKADLPTDSYKETYEAVSHRFFSDPQVAGLPERLAGLKRPLRAFGLRAVLSVVHRTALGAIQAELGKRGLIKEVKTEVSPVSSEAVENLLAALNDDSLDESGKESFLATIASFNEGATLERLARSKSDAESLALRKYDFLVASFPRRYVYQIGSTLIHTGWQTACFSKTCTDPAMWALYGGGHTGVALMFKLESRGGSSRVLPLRGTTGWRGSSGGAIPIEGDLQLPVQDVQYGGTPPEVDFFRFLGTLPEPKIRATWHTDLHGHPSPLVDKILADKEGWRRELWEKFRLKSTTKLPAWAHEQECRIVMSDVLQPYPDGRKLKFHLDHLAGVVFGVRTSVEDKGRIVKLLTEKCISENREPIPLYHGL